MLIVVVVGAVLVVFDSFVAVAIALALAIIIVVVVVTFLFLTRCRSVLVVLSARVATAIPIKWYSARF